MAIEKIEIDHGKEAYDVMKLLVGVVKHFKEGKAVSELTELLDELMAALSGMDQLDDEYKANRVAVLNSAMLGVSELVDALLKKDE